MTDEPTRAESTPPPLWLLTEEDRAWLDRMADVLPRSLIVDGTDDWLIRALVG